MSNTSILAQAPGTSSPAIDGPPTIEIDPDQVPGIEIVTGEVVEPEVEVKGAVGEALEDFVPESGIDSVDGAVNTLTDAVGGRRVYRKPAAVRHRDPGRRGGGVHRPGGRQGRLPADETGQAPRVAA